MIYAYARVSAKDRNLQRQIAALSEFGRKRRHFSRNVFAYEKHYAAPCYLLQKPVAPCTASAGDIKRAGRSILLDRTYKQRCRFKEKSG